jgi:hypothetical protein
MIYSDAPGPCLAYHEGIVSHNRGVSQEGNPYADDVGRYINDTLAIAWARGWERASIAAACSAFSLVEGTWFS